MKSKLKFFKTGTFLLALVLVVTACQKEPMEVIAEEEVSQVQTENLKVEDGVLTFANQAHFDEVYELAKNEPTQVHDLLAGLSTFENLQSLLDQTMQDLDKKDGTVDQELLRKFFTYEEESKTFELTYPFYTRSVLLDANGLVKIGDALVKYDHDFVYTIVDGSFSKLEGISLLQESGFVNGIYVSEIKQQELEDHRNVETHLCGNTVVSGGYKYGMSSKIVANSWAQGSPNKGYMRYLEITASVRKTKKSSAPYSYGGASIQGSFDYRWSPFWSTVFSADYNLTFSNNAQLHSAIVASLQNGPNTSPFDPWVDMTNGQQSGTGFFTTGLLGVLPIQCSFTF